jgi:hypothetical protein
MSEIWSNMHIGLHVKYRLLLSDFNETWNFPTILRKTLKCQISRKSVQWEPSCSMRTDGQTYMKKLIIASRKFAKGPKNQKKNNNYKKSGVIWRRIYQLNETNALNPLNPSGKYTYHQNKNKPCILASHCVYVIRVIPTINSHYIPQRH